MGNIGDFLGVILGGILAGIVCVGVIVIEASGGLFEWIMG